MFKQMRSAVKSMDKAKKILMGDHNKLVGSEIIISKEYREWLKHHLDSIYEPNDNSTKDPSYLEAIGIIKGTIKKGKVVNSKYDREDGITLTILLENGNERLLGLKDVKEVTFNKNKL